MNEFQRMQPVFANGAAAAPGNYFASVHPGGGPTGAPVQSPPIMAPGVMPLNPAAGQMPMNGNTGIVPPNMMPPTTMPVTGFTPAGGPYYPGAAGAPSGIHEMSPGVQSVGGAIAGLPGVANGPHQHQPDKPQFNHDAYRSAIQDWRAQRTPGMDHDARQDWRGLRPDRQNFMAPSA